MYGVPTESPVNVFCDKECKYPGINVNEETQCNLLSCDERSSGSRYFESRKGGWENKFGRYIDKGDCGTEEMGFLFSFILLMWSNSQGFSMMACAVPQKWTKESGKVYSLGISQHVLGIALESGTFVSSNCPFYLLITLRFPLDLYSCI
jgi:hypothetical protein